MVLLPANNILNTLIETANFSKENLMTGETIASKNVERKNLCPDSFLYDKSNLAQKLFIT